MRTLLTIIGFILCYTFAQAQAPGFMGKKFYPEYNLNYTYLGEQPKSLNESKLLSFKHSLALNYVFARKKAVAVHFEFYNIGFGVFDENSEYTFKKFPVRTIGLEYLHYPKRKSHIAPLGGYWSVNLKRHNVNLKEVIGGSTSLSSVGIGYGIRRIFFKRMTVGFHTSYNFVFAQKYFEETGELPYQISPDEVQGDASRAVSSINTFMFSFGVGYLIF